MSLCRFICVCVLPESSGSHCYVMLFTINCMLAELLYSQCQTFSFHLLQWIPSFCSWCHSWDCSTCFSLPARAPLWIIGVCGLYNYSSGLPKCESGTQSGFRLIKAPWTHTMTLFLVKWLLQFAITPFICNSYLEVMKQSSQCVTLYIYGWL